MKRISKLFLFVLVFALSFSLFACKKDNNNDKPEVKDPTISLRETTKEVEVGDEFTVVANVSNLDNPTLTYTLSEEGIVSSSEAGKYTALKAGTVTITVGISGYENVNATLTVTVKEKVLVNNITVSGDANMTEGDKQTLTATVEPSDAYDKTYTWSTSNAKLATVDPVTGEVEALKAGTVTITATASDESKKTGSLKITIKEKQYLAEAVDFTVEESMFVGDTQELNATFTPTNTSVKVVKWTTTDETVATIDESGLLTAVGAGKVTVVATTVDGSNVKASRQITVKNNLGPTEVTYVGLTTLGIGDTYQITTSDLKNDAKEELKVLSYECFEEAVEVSENGLITAKEAGTATVIIKVESAKDIEVTVEFKIVPSYNVGAEKEYKTITSALQAATEGGKIVVDAGTYSENITISKKDILLCGPNANVLGNQTRNEEAVLTGKITLGKAVENVSIKGFKFEGNASIVNTKGDDNNSNLYNFTFENNLVESGLTTGKGFVYFVEGSSGYSYNLTFKGNKFSVTSSSSTLDSMVYIDNNVGLNILYNTFVNIPGKGFYINDTTKGLAGITIVKGNTFENVKNAFFSNWGSPYPNLTKGFYIEVTSNTFNNVSGEAIHFGQFNNADEYDHILVSENTFTSVGTGVYFNRVQNVFNIIFLTVF